MKDGTSLAAQLMRACTTRYKLSGQHRFLLLNPFLGTVLTRLADHE